MGRDRAFAVHLPQIETPSDVVAVASLAAPEWIDATMLRPYDLALNLDRCWAPKDPDLVQAIETVHRNSAQAGKPCGMVANSPEQARFWIERGFRFLIYSEAEYDSRRRANWWIAFRRSGPREPVRDR